MRANRPAHRHDAPHSPVTGHHGAPPVLATHGRGAPRILAFILCAAVGFGPSACAQPSSPAEEIVSRAIEHYGGERFDRIEIDFRMREHDFRLVRDDGRYLYERTGINDEGAMVREVMDNDGTYRWVEGVRDPLTESERASVETAVNSVVYFGFLPFRLDDPAVRLDHLGTAELEGHTYDKVEVTFEAEGGGRDWEDRFIYWFDPEEGTLDYLAYRYHTGEGGTRFRKAVNRREVGGIIVQDYENYTADPEIEDVAEYDRWFEEGRLTLVSEVRLEDVDVSVP